MSVKVYSSLGQASAVRFPPITKAALAVDWARVPVERAGPAGPAAAQPVEPVAVPAVEARDRVQAGIRVAAVHPAAQAAVQAEVQEGFSAVDLAAAHRVDPAAAPAAPLAEASAGIQAGRQAADLAVVHQAALAATQLEVQVVVSVAGVAVLRLGPMVDRQPVLAAAWAPVQMAEPEAARVTAASVDRVAAPAEVLEAVPAAAQAMVAERTQ